MKRKRKIHYSPGSVPGKKLTETKELFHPLSYFLLGGTDLSGQELDKSAQVEYDNEEDLEILEAEGASSVAIGDPRVSFFDIVETAGVRGAEGALASSPRPSADSGETSGANTEPSQS